ncbi:MAG: DUF2271 domain-containing protein [Paludibacter sp.]
MSTILALSISCTTTNPPADTSSTSPGLTVSTLTTTTNGQYAPSNIVAIWVENSSGVFVKSLLVNASQRKSHLTKWISSSKGNITDAKTGATRNNHGIVTAVWNGTDTSGKVVANGAYKVCMELTESASTGSYSSFPFTKGTAAETQTPAKATGFASIGIKWLPL